MKIFFKYFLLTHLICIGIFFAQRGLSSMFIKDIFVSSTEMWILIFVNILLILSPFFAIGWHYFKNNPQYHHQIFKKILFFLQKLPCCMEFGHLLLWCNLTIWKIISKFSSNRVAMWFFGFGFTNFSFKIF